MMRRAGAVLVAALLGSGCAGSGVHHDPVASCQLSPDSCLTQAMERGDLLGFRRLLARVELELVGDVDGDTLMHRAAAAEDPMFLDALLARGQDPDVSNTVSRRTPLMSAILAERDPQIYRLLSAHVDLTRADRTGNTALHIAAQINDPARVLRLLEAGASPGQINAQGKTFQAYLFLARHNVLDETTAADLDRVVAWLASRGLLLSEEVDRAPR